MITDTSLTDFYSRNVIQLPESISGQSGHFNVFETEKLYDKEKGTRIMPYSRRAYYKISWIRGKSRAEYADKVVNIAQNALLFATPKIPYHWLPADSNQTGMFCIFTPEFISPENSGVRLDDLPIFQPGNLPVLQLSPDEIGEIEYIFRKMCREMAGDYQYKHDLLRTLVLELIHYGQKLQPMPVLNGAHNASQRITTIFIELLERQFPIEPGQQLTLRTASEYADRLAVHVNHLNKALKSATGSTTTQLIAARLMQEAKVLLRQTDNSIASIAYTFGFDNVAHFSNFFKKQTGQSPLEFRG